ncbi:MAG: DUF3788 family protein [Breznakibacter sp.]
MALSTFDQKGQMPTDGQLVGLLGEKHQWWKSIEGYCLEKWPKLMQEWVFSGKNYGWNYRLKDKRRVVVYLIPIDTGFLVAFMFGEKAFEVVQQSDIDNRIKTDLQNARPYVEGRGIRYEITHPSQLSDVMKLIDIKQMI